MGISTIGATLDEISRFEEAEARYFGELAKRAKDPGAELVASWLAGRKGHVPELFKAYRPSEIDILEKSPIFEERFESEPEAWFARRLLDDSAPGEEVLDAAIECGRLLLESARHIAEQRLDTLVLGFAKSFQAIALREIKELKKMKALGYF
ncbi:MAG TPA: hypothetical protein VMV44_13065 [Rectinemataceae bacterium]|nr:hypothetical protein [Rectinemataceae bacterium]